MAAGTRLGWKKRLMPPPCHFPENESHFWRKKRFYTFFMATALLCMMKLAALTPGAEFVSDGQIIRVFPRQDSVCQIMPRLVLN